MNNIIELSFPVWALVLTLYFICNTILGICARDKKDSTSDQTIFMTGFILFAIPIYLIYGLFNLLGKILDELDKTIDARAWLRLWFTDDYATIKVVSNKRQAATEFYKAKKITQRRLLAMDRKYDIGLAAALIAYKNNGWGDAPDEVLDEQIKFLYGGELEFGTLIPLEELPEILKSTAAKHWFYKDPAVLGKVFLFTWSTSEDVYYINYVSKFENVLLNTSLRDRKIPDGYIKGVERENLPKNIGDMTANDFVLHIG